MTAAVFRSSSALSIPPSQNTAPVLEFRCLFTHDLRRKQKRWQDGFLKYHTFNRRAMVYDLTRNFIGDTHCAQGTDLQEGDEVNLEKGGVIVQVSEPIGRTDTDLSELLQSRTKTPSHDRRRPNRDASSPVYTRATPAPAGSATAPFSKHKSLNAMLGTPRGPLGKAAIPIKSPFEQRNPVQNTDMWEEGGPTKRQKTEAWNVTRTTKALQKKSGNVMSNHKAATPGLKGKSTKIIGEQPRLGVKEVIDLSSDPVGSDETIAHQVSRYGDRDSLHDIAPAIRPATPFVVTRHPTIPTKTTGLSCDHVLREAAKDMQTSINRLALATSNAPSLPGHMVDPSRSKPSRITGHAVARKSHKDNNTEQGENTHVITTSKPVDRDHTMSGVPENSSRSKLQEEEMPSSRKGASLKLVSSAPRKMLICQDQLARRPSTKKTEEAKKASRSVLRPESSDDESPLAPHKQRLLDRIANLGKKRHTTPNSSEDPASQGTTCLPESSVAFENMPSASTRKRVNSPSSTRVSIHDQHVRTKPNNDPIIDDVGREEHKVSRQQSDPTLATRQTTKSRQARYLKELTPQPEYQNAALVTKDTRPSSKTAPAQPPPPPPPPPVVPTERPQSRFAAKRKGPQNKSVNIDLRSGGDPISTTLLAKPFKPPSKPSTVKEAAPVLVDSDLGPWSREAFDLFAWRPPDRDAEGKKIVPVTGAEGIV